jgi:hypothetical protein
VTVKSNSNLIIRNWQRSLRDDIPTVSATVGEFELYFSGAGLARSPESGDAFLTVALLPAMALGADIDLRDIPPISPVLHQNIGLIQEIWTTWNKRLRKVDIYCNVAENESPGEGNATFFSGGIDALHAAITGGLPGERLVFINGFDFDADVSTFGNATRRVERLSTTLRMPLETVHTNWIWFTRQHKLARLTTFGSVLAAIGQLLAPARMTIAASHSWDRLAPEGSHPLLDPLWSTGRTEIRHLGSNATRTEKTALIASQPDLLKDLWVCFDYPDRNCGRCTKCVRTRAMLRLVGAIGGPFPDAVGEPMTEYAAIARTGMEQTFLPEMIHLAESTKQLELRAALAHAERSVLRRQVLRSLVSAAPFVSRLRASKHKPDLRPWGDGPVPVIR